MTPLVVDSSVAVKWFFDEPHSDAALDALDDRFELHSPELMLLEVDNVVCKRVRRREVSQRIGREIRAALREFPVRTLPIGPLLEPGFEIALATGASLYDCLFVALAAMLDARLVTADRRFRDSMSQAKFGNYILWIEELPR